MTRFPVRIAFDPFYQEEVPVYTDEDVAPSQGKASESGETIQ